MTSIQPSRTRRWRLALFGYASLLIYRLVAIPGFAWYRLEDEVRLTYYAPWVFVPRPISISDLVVNVAGFGLLGFLLQRGLEERAGRRPKRWTAMWQAGLTGFLISLVVEMLQQLIPGRVASGLDILTDTLGATAGGYLAWRHGPRIDRAIRTWIDERSGWPVVWCTIGLAVMQLWPFDLRTAVSEVTEGMRQVQLNPLEKVPGGWSGMSKRVWDLVMFVPLGWLAMERMPAARRWATITLVGLAVGGGLEAAQVFVEGRVGSVQQALLALGGVLIGARIRAAQARPPGTTQAILLNIFSWPTLATLLVLGAGELLLRHLDFPPRPSSALLQADPFSLWEMQPGVRHEEGVTAAINNLGLRGPEISPKPAGVRRFLTLGDSSIYGFGVEDAEVFSSVAAVRLGPRVEAVNGGIGGYSTLQSIRLLEKRWSQLEPDLLVIGNLWSDNSFDSFVDKELLAAFGQTEVLRAHQVHRVHRFFSQSALFRLFDWTLRGRHQKVEPRKVSWMLGQKSKLGVRRVSLGDYARNLEVLVRMGKAIGAESIFLLPANEEDVGGPPPVARAWDPYRQAMRDTARRHGSPLLDVPRIFHESGHPKEALLRDPMHPTALGHRLMGEALATLLKEKGWLEGRALMAGGDGAPIPAYTDPFLHAAPPPEGSSPPSPASLPSPTAATSPAQ